MATNHKFLWFFDHAVMWSYVANEKRHFQSLEAYVHQTLQSVAFDNKLLFRKSNDLLVLRSNPQIAKATWALDHKVI